MADEDKKVEAAKAPAEKTPARKYIWNGIRPKNPALFNDYGGGAKIKPWSMTDAEIDALLATRPDLGRLWEKKG